MSRDPGTPSHPPSGRTEHIATISYLGRFWDVLLEHDHDARHQDVQRALFCFSPSDLNAGERPARTAAILVERSWDDVVRKAKSFEEHQLIALLRSALPD